MTLSHRVPPTDAAPATVPATLVRHLARRVDAKAPRPGELWLLAFSGGPDSTALAALLAPIARERNLHLLLVHVDHRLDADSGRRAEAARALADKFGLPFRVEVVDVPVQRARGESPEAAARRLRYAALDQVATEHSATRILTAHHRDDQIETVLLRVLRGASIERLGGIAPSRGRLLRPLLEVPRSEIEQFLRERDFVPTDDPTNRDLRTPRNLVRHRLLPALRATEPDPDPELDLDATLLALGAASGRLRDRLDGLLAARFRSLEADRSADISEETRGDQEQTAPRNPFSTSAPVSFLTGLPDPLRLPALHWFLEHSGISIVPSFPSMKAFVSSLLADESATLDLPTHSVRLAARRDRLEWRPAKSPTPPFSYTFSIPGEARLPELGLVLKVRRTPVEPWMFQGDRRRVGFEAETDQVTVRSRRPGERMRPLGAPGSRKLKAILIDRAIPAGERDRLPLLEIDGELAWVPGVALAERFALGDRRDCWLAELTELEAPPGPSDRPEPGERMAR